MPTIESLSEIVFYIFGASVAWQILHFIVFHLRFIFYRSHTSENQAKAIPVSVIICAKNEDTNLKKNLPEILRQDYPVFEVIVVDDNSEDGTTEYLFYLSQKEPRLKKVKVGNVKKLMAGKKFALTLGIKAATYETLLLTDADCYPSGPHWLSNMMSAYHKKTEIVLGYGAYEKESGFLNKVIRYETVQTALNYMSFALAKMPYMGVGRNLSYQKHLFFQSGGFTEHRTVLSGDDDLFINKVATGKNTSLALQKDSYTYSPPKTTWQDWKEQKSRHLSTGKYYKFKHKFFLGLQSISHFLLYPSFIFLIIILYQWYIVLAAFLFRWMLLRISYTSAMNKLHEPDLKKFIELFDILQVYYYLRFSKSVIFKMNYRWN